MALRRARPWKWSPAGCSDAIDGSAAFPGAMASLANLIRSASTKNMWVPRPAAVSVSTALTSTISAELVIGDIAYGMQSNGSGQDIPYAVNLGSGSAIAISGVVAGTNTPTTLARTQGPPPILAQVGTRIIVTHPGFSGSHKFGWIDIGSFSSTFTAELNSSTIVTAVPSVLGMQPGMTVSGAGIPANTTVVSTQPNATVSDVQCTIVAGGTNQLRNVSSTNVTPLVSVVGPFIPPGTICTAVDSVNNVVTLSNTITLTAPVQTVVSYVSNNIILSQNATLTGSASLTVSGGTPSAPQWGAGDTAINGLPSTPVGVAQMNGRAYFACGTDGIVFSDSLLPCQVSFASQALKPSDGVAVTAVAPLPLAAPLTGGIIQSIIAVQGITGMQQITGDSALSNLLMNRLNVATGTNHPLSLATTTLGLAFLSPTGLRFVGFDGKITDPVGTDGMGVSVPFIDMPYSANWACAAANADVLRISTVDSSDVPQQEWWYDLVDHIWSGPHTFPSALIQPWRNSFVKTVSGSVVLWQSDSTESGTSVYTENGTPLSWTYKTVLSPDNEQDAQDSFTQGTIAGNFPNNTTLAIAATDESGATLATVNLAIGTHGGYFRSWPILWPQEVVFKQMQISITAPSAANLSIGALRLQTRILGYLMQPVGGAPE